MDFALLERVIVTGLMLGTLYVLVTVGYTIIFGIMHVINFAHGHILMLGAYGVYYFVEQQGVSFPLALFITVVILSIFAIFCERILFRPVSGQMLPTVIATIGLLMVLESLAYLLFGTTDRSVTSILPYALPIGNMRLSADRIMASAVALALVAGLNFVVYRTKLGRAMRAIEQDRDSALLQGVSIKYVSLFAIVTSFALAAAAGGLMATFTTINPVMGLTPVIKAFIIIVIGGLGSVPGCIVAGFILGFVDSFGGTFLGAAYSNMVGFALIILILLIRPQGLFGRVMEWHG